MCVGSDLISERLESDNTALPQKVSRRTKNLEVDAEVRMNLPAGLSGKADSKVSALHH